MHKAHEQNNNELMELKRELLLSKADVNYRNNKYEMEHIKYIVTLVCMIAETVVIWLLLK